MRKINELFEILLEDFKKGERTFICNAIDRLYNKEIISLLELQLLLTTFAKEKPTSRKNKEFYQKEKDGKNGGWFVVQEGAVCSIRVKFLEMLVEKTKSKSKY